MYGICGYVNNGQPVAPVLREMLSIMEKHRLDSKESCGMATVQEGKIAFMKNVGSVDSVFPLGGDWSQILLGSVG